MSEGKATKRLKVAFVVQRYGTEVNGGSEALCRMIAERMVKRVPEGDQAHWDLEVLTSCALDYVTWENSFPEGLASVNGVQVRRFRVDFPRSTFLFNRLSEAIYSGKDSEPRWDQWVREQGPYSSDFLRYLKENGKSYDVFFFFTYLYGFTLMGLPEVSDRSILIPTAHDEPSFYLPLFESLFSKAKGFLFQTPEERDLVLSRFKLQTPHQVTSVGIDFSEFPEREIPSSLARYSDLLSSPYLLYLGRIDESKGCRTLFEFFQRFKEKHPQSSVNLVLLGKSVMPIPRRPDIHALGFVENEVKSAFLAHAIGLVIPSAYESLSLVALEAWASGKPILVNRKSSVLEGQCQRSQGGLSYESYEEFETQLKSLCVDESLRIRLGQNGRAYIKAHYSWSEVEKAYLQWAQRVQLNEL